MKWKKLIGWNRGNWLFKSSLVAIAMFLVIGILANFLANNKPLLASENGHWKSPVIMEMLVRQGWSSWKPAEQNRNWKTTTFDWAIWPPVPFLPSDQDEEHVNVPPLTDGHLLGTDHIGRDLFSALIHAIRFDLTIGIFAMLIAGFIGILLGGTAGFFGDHSVQISIGQLVFTLLLSPVAAFYGFIIWQSKLEHLLAQGLFPLLPMLLFCTLVFLFILCLPILVGMLFRHKTALSRPVSLPLDVGISRLIEVVVSIPVIYLLIMLVGAKGGNSIIWVIMAIGLTRWTGIARLTRAEMLKIRKQEYTESGRALGYSQWRLLLRHAAPNAIPPAIIAIAFGIANAILLESFLAFIGLGIPPDTPTWGSLLNAGRQNPSAWWMALFPGISIFLTVMVFNLIGDQLNDLLAGKSTIKKK